MVRNYQSADCSFKNTAIVLFIIIFGGTLQIPVRLLHAPVVDTYRFYRPLSVGGVAQWLAEFVA